MPDNVQNAAPSVRCKEVTVSVGVSVEINRVWYRLTAELNLEVNGSSNSEFRKRVFAQAFAEASENVEKQIADIAALPPGMAGGQQSRN